MEKENIKEIKLTKLLSKPMDEEFEKLYTDLCETAKEFIFKNVQFVENILINSTHLMLVKILGSSSFAIPVEITFNTGIDEARQLLIRHEQAFGDSEKWILYNKQVDGKVKTIVSLYFYF